MTVKAVSCIMSRVVANMTDWRSTLLIVLLISLIMLRRGLKMLLRSLIMRRTIVAGHCIAADKEHIDVDPDCEKETESDLDLVNEIDCSNEKSTKKKT